jgi:hypothetical protein
MESGDEKFSSPPATTPLRIFIGFCHFEKAKSIKSCNDFRALLERRKRGDEEEIDRRSHH